MSQDWSFQIDAIEFGKSHPNCVMDLPLGGGKTKVSIELLRIFGCDGHRKSLVVCPAAVRGVWRGQLLRHAPGQFYPLILDVKGNAAKKAELIEQSLVNLRAGSQPLVVVVNYESMFREPVYSILLREKWNLMICDELQKIKAHNTRSGKACWLVGKNASRRIGLTGTLLPHSPADAFGSYRFLDDTIFGRYVTRFRSDFAIMDPYIPGRVKEWKNQDVMQQRINSIRFRIERDVLTLPDRQDIVVEVPLSAKGQKLYNEMKKDAVVFIRELVAQQPSEVQNNREELERVLSASNAAVKSLRLLQLAQGYCTAEDGEEVDTDTEKRRMLLEMLEQTDEPVVVYGYFKHDMRVVADCCQILGRRYGEVSGSRKDLTEHGLYPEGVDVLGVQSKSGSSGIDLTRSRIAFVLNTGTISSGDYDQLMARQYRPGQTRNVVFYHFVSPKTVDATVRRAREEKRDVVEAILNGLIEGGFDDRF